MKLESKSELAHLKVDSGITKGDHGDVTMEVLADIGGFEVAWLRSALLVGAAIGLFAWDLARSDTL